VVKEKQIMDLKLAVYAEKKYETRKKD